MHVVKKILLGFLFILPALALPAAPLEELMSQAQTEYARGNLTEGVRLLGLALATNPTAAAQKNALADAYAEIGVKEYDRRNFKNAYECFKNAVKLAPTNQTASRYFWKMRNESDVEKLRNEAGDTAQLGPSTGQAGTAAATGAAAGGAAASAAQPAVDAATHKEALDKLAKAEQELASLRTTAGLSRLENDALRAELERQRQKAENELSAIHRTAATAAQESAAAKAELERQKQVSALETETLRKLVAASSQEAATAKAEAEKQKQLSALEAETLRRTAGVSAQESAAIRAELEKQRLASERELETARKATAAATLEAGAVKAEVERQRQLAEQQREDLQKAALAAKDDSQTLRSELGQYQVLVDQLKQRVTSTDAASRQDTKALTDLVALYQKSMEGQEAASEQTAKVLADQLAEQRRLLDEQKQALLKRNLLLFGSLGLLALILLGLLFLVFRARARFRRARATGMPGSYAAIGAGAEGAQPSLARIAGRDSLLLEFVPEAREKGESTASQPSSGETGMYRDLLRAERLKRMHDQMKQGTLTWDTVREYIGELEKDLRIDILKVVEREIAEGKGVDPRAVLAVLLPFLTEHDDYLRDKAESLAKGALAGATPRRGQALLTALPEPAQPDEGDSPLSVAMLLEITEELKQVLKDRERSTATAKIAQGLARQLNLSAADADLLYKSALAHDVGYLALDRDELTRILGKPVLAEEDLRFIEGHAKRGVEYFKGTKLPQAFKDAILYHHERNDGSGYPKGLAGAKIPLFAKLVGIAETFVALTSDRPYRDKLSSETALAVIRDGVGKKFDKEHVSALEALVRRTGEAL